MANGADGSLEFDTGLDTEGFEKGSDKLLSAVKHLTQSINSLGQIMGTSFQKIAPILANIAGVAQQTDGAMSSMTGTMEQQAEAINSMSAGTSKAKESVSSLEKDIDALQSRMDSISESAQSGFSNGKAILSFDASIRDIESKLEEAGQKLIEFGNTEIPTAEFSTLSSELEAAEKKVSSLTAKRTQLRSLGVDKESKQWKTLTAEFEAATGKVESLQSQMQALKDSGNAFRLGSSTEDFVRMRQTLTDTALSLETNKAIIDQEAIAQARLNVEIAKEQVARAETAQQWNSSIAQLQSAQMELNDLASSMSLSAVKPKEEDEGAWARFGNVLKDVGSKGAVLIGTLAKASFSGIANGVKKAASSIKTYIAKAKEASMFSKSLVKSLTSIKTMLMSRIKRMFISEIINGAKEALQAFAKFDGQFNKAMSNIKNAAGGLSANLAVTFGGLIQAIEPVLTRIISVISKAISYINALFGLLSGKGTMTVAKKQTQSYADSLKSAGGAAKELNEQVYGFDELNKRSDNSDSGGGGSDVNPEDLFETVDIGSMLPDSISDWFERIKAAFKSERWEDLGSIISEGFNKAMDVADNWFNTKLRPIGVKWSSNLARIFNGLTSGFDWTKLGKTIADGFNAAFDIVNTFLTTYNFQNLGAGFAKGINGIIDSIDWNLMGQTFANKLNAFVNFIYGLFNTLDWSGIGSSAATLVTSWISAINWGQLGATLSAGVVGLLNSLIAFMGTMDWRSIATAVEQFIGGIDWGGIVSGLSKGIGAQLGAIGSLLQQFLLDAINSVKGYFQQKTEEAGGNVIAGFLKGIWDAIKGIGKWIYDNIFKPFWDGLCEAFKMHSPSKVMEESGHNVIEGLLNGIKEKWEEIKQFFKTSLENLKNDLSTAWENIKTTASTAWGSIKQTCVTAFDGIKTSASTSWNNIKSTINTAGNTIKTSLTTAFNTIKTNASTAWNNIKSTTTSTWSSITSTVTSKWNSLKSSLNSSDWTSVGSNICNGIRNGINSGWNWLTSTVSSLARSLLSSAKSALGIRSPSREFAKIGAFIDEGLENGIDGSKPDVLRTVSDLATDVIDGMSTETPDLSLSVDETVSGLDAVADKLAGIAQIFTNITNMLTTMNGLSIPSIASGSVIPAMTKISDVEFSSMKVDGFEEFARDFDEYMSDNTALLKRIIEILLKLNLNIDIEALSKMITSAQRGTIRSYGGA